MKVRLLRARYFVWVLVVAAFYLAWLGFGLPHLLWSYEWRDNGQGYSLYAKRFYTRCTYVGPYGALTEHFPRDGKCGWLRFQKNWEEG